MIIPPPTSPTPGPAPATTRPGARIKHVRRHLGMSQKHFAQQLNLSQSTLSQIENDHYRPSYESLLLLATALRVDCNWLLLGEGAPYGERASPPGRERDGTGFPTVPEKARAGYSGTDRDEHWLSQLKRYEIPGFRPDADIVIFQALGQSMIPTIDDQDFVIAERIDGPLESYTGHTVVVVVRDEIYVKRLTNYDITIERLTLASDNPKFKTIDIGREEALEVWHVVGRITRSLAPTLLNQDYRIRQLEGGLQELQSQVDKLTSALGG